MKQKVSEQLRACKYVAYTSDCWSSRAQHWYITMTAHVVDAEWTPKTFILNTQRLEERHTAANLSDAMGHILNEWGFASTTTAIVNNNAANVTNALIQMATRPAQLMPISWQQLSRTRRTSAWNI